MAALPCCLIVDDDPFSGMVISQMMAQVGCKTDVEEKSEQVPNLLKPTAYDTVPAPQAVARRAV